MKLKVGSIRNQFRSGKERKGMERKDENEKEVRRTVRVKTAAAKGYFREVNICSREMLDFSVVKCDLFYSREA
jgi:hypothetical protein